MQVSKVYSGTLENVGTTGTRQVSYGLDTTITTYPAKADFINQSIADFLHDECGVDAAYEARGSSTEKFLWVYGVPFLYAMPTASSNFFNLYGPKYATALATGSTTTTVTNYSAFFSAASSGLYSFTLYFTGNPKTGFALRVRGYLTTASISTSFTVRFVKATHVGSGVDATVWMYGNPSIASNGTFGFTNGVSLNEDGIMDESSFSSATISYQPSLMSKAINKTSSPGKFPLIPMMVGVWRLSGVYYYLTGYGIIPPVAASSVNQTEVEIGGRRLIVTTPEILTAGYINIGLIEVDD